MYRSGPKNEKVGATSTPGTFLILIVRVRVWVRVRVMVRVRVSSVVEISGDLAIDYLIAINEKSRPSSRIS